MKNQFVADIGDFGKVLLLNYLCYKDQSIKEVDYSLGINWYYTKDEIKSNAGKHTDYLLNDKENLRACLTPFSEMVFDKLQNVLNTGRLLGNLEKSNIFPQNTIFFNDPLRSDDRHNWLMKSINQFSKCNLIFFDPDNGIIPSNESKNLSSMLAMELNFYYNNLDSNFISYYHFNKFHGSKENNVKDHIIPILKKIDKNMKYRILVFNKKSVRYYIIINKLNDEKLNAKVGNFLDSIDESIFSEIVIN